MKIILVDDELSAIKTFLPNVVDDLCVDCKMFMNSPRAALEYVRINKVDVAFLDVKMPEINGIDLAERMIAVSPSIKIVFISAYVRDEEEIKKRFGDSVVGFCHKPYSNETVKNLLQKFNSEVACKSVYIRTFDNFDLFVNGVAIDFSSSKAKELLALLTDAKGSYLSMDTVMGNLWADKNTELSKRLYRDAVCRLRMTLKENNVEKLVTFERGRAVMNTAYATCDMWDYLEKGGTFSGRYMPQYSWSIITESTLERLSKKRD